MAYIFTDTHTRPNRLVKKKDKSYHREYAKYCLGGMANNTYRSYIDKCLINWSFFKGGDGQWIFEEDIESFFLDESGDIRNRLKWTKNVVKPMVQQYIGNAIRLSYDASAESISDFVINKREKGLAEIKAYHTLADGLPYFNDLIKENFQLEKTYDESATIFINVWTDSYEKDVNNLINYVKEDININELKVQITRNLSLCGLGIYKGFEQYGSYQAEATNPLFFFWDLSAKKPDLSDSEFMGEWYYMDAPSILENHSKLLPSEVTLIENYSVNSNRNIHKMVNGIYSNNGGKIPVYEVYWKDVERNEFGWVLDEFGYPYYTLINDDTSSFTDKDLIDPITDEHKKEFKGKKKHKVYNSILRYAILIPAEEIGGINGDIVLEYGIAPYQEKRVNDPSKVKFPYKCYTWVYDRGEILTPLDDVIDPQRFLNRTLSVVESQMSNMRGSGTVISKSAVDPRDGESDVLRNINSSKPIFVDTDRVGSVANAIGTYGSTIGAGTLNMFQVISEVQRSIQDVTGVNESMTGSGKANDALVGVVESQIQRGSLIQEPFYWALTSILKQAHEHIANVGKKVYYDNPRKLSMMVGDKGMVRISITKDHLEQDYRIFIKRGESRAKKEQDGNQLLFTLLQAGLIDQNIFSNLFNRSTPEIIAKALRDYSFAKQEASDRTLQAESKGNEIADQQEAELAKANIDEQQALSEMEQIENRKMEQTIDNQ